MPNINTQAVDADLLADGDTLEVRTIDLDAVGDEEFADLVKRASCSNDGKITRVKPEYRGGCALVNSIGFQSSHNCAGRGGRSYLCVQSRVAQCYTSNLRNLNFENGECFTR